MTLIQNQNFSFYYMTSEKRRSALNHVNQIIIGVW